MPTDFRKRGIIVTKAIIALLRAFGAGQVSAQTGSVDDSAKAEGGAFAVSRSSLGFFSAFRTSD
jgi:hypothetical protein